MKILWMSDSPTSPSGFGNVSRFVCSGLAALGHQVAILGWQARGEPQTWNHCTIYPVRRAGFGADVLLGYLYRLRPDVLVTLADVWWLAYISDPAIANFMRTASIPWALYYPIDGDMGEGRLPPSWVHVLKTVDLPIAMSQYGKDVTERNGVRAAYIPHGVDTAIFYPPVDKEAAKAAQGYAGRFVVLCDARNQPRKLLPRLLEAFRRFCAGKHDVLLHLHCDSEDPAAATPEYWYNLRGDIDFLGLADAVRLTPGMSIAKGILLEQLAAIYQAADVHLLASWGEGFGLPTLQAAAAGAVPMASNYTASKELVIPHGEALRVAHFLEDQFGLLRCLIDVDDTVEKIERLYQNRVLLAARAEASRRFAEPYDWKHIVPQWHELLQSQVPRLRVSMRERATTSEIALDGNSAHGATEVTEVLRRVLPNNTQVKITVATGHAGQISAEVARDAQTFQRTLTIPVTLPPADDGPVKTRATGYVYLGSAADVPAFLMLRRIFPGLFAWSSNALDLGPSENGNNPAAIRVVAGAHPDWSRHMASTTLALDIAAVDLVLPGYCARFATPCIGLAAAGEQQRLWPELTLARPDARRAAELGRAMLTDQGMASVACRRAQAYLAH